MGAVIRSVGGNKVGRGGGNGCDGCDTNVVGKGSSVGDVIRSEGGKKVGRSGGDGGGVERGESSERSLLPGGRSPGGAGGNRV